MYKGIVGTVSFCPDGSRWVKEAAGLDPCFCSVILGRPSRCLGCDAVAGDGGPLVVRRPGDTRAGRVRTGGGGGEASACEGYATRYPWLDDGRAPVCM